MASILKLNVLAMLLFWESIMIRSDRFVCGKVINLGAVLFSTPNSYLRVCGGG